MAHDCCIDELMLLYSLEVVEDNSDEEYVKPAPKKIKSSTSITDFFDAIPSEPAKPKPKPKAAPKAPAKKKKAASEDDNDASMNMDVDSSPPVGAKRRPVRAAASRKKWALSSEPGDEVGDDTSIFEISD